MEENKNVLLISHLAPPITGIASWTKRIIENGFSNWNIYIINSNMINGRDPYKNPKKSIKDEYIRTKNIYNQERKILKENKIDVVHTNIPCTSLGMIREMGCARIAKKYNVPFILHCHCTVSNVINKWWKKFLLKRLLKKCQGVIVLNSKSYDFIKSLNYKGHLEIIPNFVDSNELIEPKVKNEVKNIYYVGGVSEGKGAHIIIEVAKVLTNINFHLIGYIEPKIEKMHRTKNVKLYGAKNHNFVMEELKKADVFLFLSQYWGEGFSVALVEAMAKGIPSIVTDWAANKDMVENKGGIVLKERSVEALKTSIQTYIDNPLLLNEYSLWNIEKVKSSYIDNIVLKRYTSFYQTIIKREGGKKYEVEKY